MRTLILTWILTIQTSCNMGWTQASSVKDSSRAQKPEVFTSGFIDILSNGQMNASARFIRLYIGEKGKLTLPLTFYSGVSANSFQTQPYAFGQRSNDHLANGFINPLSGLMNVSTDGLVFFNKSTGVTRPAFAYHLGARLLTAFREGDVSDPQAGTPVNFMNTVAATGIYFQTGAWERNNAKNLGIIWLALRYHSSYTKPERINEFAPNLPVGGLYLGYSSGVGVDINNLINLKAFFYKYHRAPEMVYQSTTYQFSFNYSMK